ncbi:hypothetical protein G4Z16_18275 [Streptomyces bathyalis]|uniref:Uncharacterized protein n=1 Tax=Streptomyces bathyalis TaxID=2710756 RepID=A0A7T1T814_9ACTN|nr:hypothetical protein [Streptomyces bathyalis]QPP08023.1 hypothetical protein G4Z16_18275 [Streptomyces bathyalis]
MPSTNDIRNTLTDPKPLYFAAGVIDKIREEAPERIAAVRATDPKEVQARFTKQAKETQAKVSQTLGSIDTDIKKLREQAQHLALQSVGIAAEYAVKAREAYDELADRGRGAVANWRGEESGTTEVTVEREPVKVAEPPAQPRGTTKPGATSTTSTAGTTGTTGTSKNGQGSAGAASSAAKKSAAARKTTTARTTTPKPGTAKANGSKKTPPKSDS